jgi:hypothetical protein
MSSIVARQPSRTRLRSYARPRRLATLGALSCAAALLVAMPSQAAKPKRGALYTGQTTQTAPVAGSTVQNKLKFRVSRTGRRLVFLGVTTVAGDDGTVCLSTLAERRLTGPGFGIPVPAIVIRSSGRFSGTSTRLRISGRFSTSKRATGTITVTGPCTATDVPFTIRR